MVADREFGFTRDREDARAVQQYLNPLPRSVIRRNAYMLLDGEWRFAVDPEDRGLREQWYLGHRWERTAMWPGSIEDHMASAKDMQQTMRPWQDTVVAWYEREFEVPEAWTSSPDRVPQVSFGACGYETRVWLNGHPLKTVEGEDIHYGEYTSFSYELPPELLKPVNRLTVRIADSLDADLPRGKQESHVYKRGGIWYQTYTGSVRSVWLEPVERNRLRSRLAVISTVEDRLVEFNFTTRIHTPGDYKLRLVVAGRGESQPMAVEEINLPLGAGEKEQRIALELPKAELWSPSKPNLYHLTAELTSPTGNISRIETHFGLRKIESRGRRVYLNNDPLYLDGILYQPGTATYEQIRLHMLGMKELGCNLVRVHISGVDPRIYDLADEMGMLLWVEVPSPHSSNERSRANHWAEMMRMLVMIGSHPSVAIWSVYNEDWGVQDLETSPETRAYITRVYDYMRIHYPQLLVVDNDGWRHLSVEGRITSDLLSVHLYTPDLDRWRDKLDRLVSGANEGLMGNPLVIGDPFLYRGQLPLVVSEWGGWGWRGYGGPEDAAVKAERIRAFKRELRARPIAGDVYTQATSIEEEDNGIMDIETGELQVPPGTLDSRDLVPAEPDHSNDARGTAAR